MADRVYKCLNPVGIQDPVEQYPLSPRLDSLDGKTIYFSIGAGGEQDIIIPLTKRLEHWGGAADGTIHFPVATIVFSVPLPSEDARTGKIEYSDAVVDRGSP